jgi:FAD/FMN-containing dehydrogenase
MDAVTDIRRVSTPRDCLGDLKAIVGAQWLIDDPAEIAIWCQDIYTAVAPCVAVVQPASTEEVAAVVRAATSAGLSVTPRGGGMSYTSGYLPDRHEAVMVELTRLDRIVEINLEDMYVTVEGGCTWAAIRDALRGRGVRTPYWGPLSGLKSTVGGAASQNSFFFGAGQYGTAADSVIALEVVLADGRVLNTGSSAAEFGAPFSRHYGPDLTGLFCGDTGALGIKTRVTLRLVPEAAETRFASFIVMDAAAHLRAMAEISRRGLSSECFSFDPFLQKQRMVREGLLKDIKTLASVVGAGGSFFKGVAQGARMVAAGRRFLDEDGFSIHVVIEADHPASADARLTQVREIVAAEGGRETENTIPKVIHAAPFGPPNSMIGPRGERWVPVHVVLPHSAAAPVYEKLEALRARHDAEIRRHGIGIGYLCGVIGCSATNIEPVFYWRDELLPMHRLHVEDRLLAKMQTFSPNPEARAFVDVLRREMQTLFREAGGTHFQVGKSYPYKAALRPEAWDLLTAIKDAVDPRRLMNPGALGLD